MQLFPEEMASERLRFERVHPDETDVFEFYEHQKRGAPGIDAITRYVTWDPAATPKETAEFIEHCGEQFEAGEGATYVARPREGEAEAGEFAGVAGMGVDWDRRTATFGTWLRKPFWGRGYSGERAARFMELAFDRLDLECVTVSHDPENTQSERAISKYVERFGGRREGRIRNDIVIDGEPRDSVRYSISTEEWAANS
ncbi:GNAT family N-acetyltransferase [Natronomonas sp. EA1]|uniref:GNAT family N-acetyltransferase n=1 Tax=Natronomonas sp. EA1 TaxID=3421655 RepID=UPI003EBB4805